MLSLKRSHSQRVTHFNHCTTDILAVAEVETKSSLTKQYILIFFFKYTFVSCFFFFFFFCTVHKYVVSVHTGDRWGAETFANVYIILYGKRGDTGVRNLHTPLTTERKFQRNKVMAQECCLTCAGPTTGFTASLNACSS